MSTIIESIEQRQLRKDIPRFKAGDTVRVHFQVIEGQRRRVQVFEGIVIKRQGSGARETFTVRKQSFGVGVERTFPVHSPKIEKIEVGAIGDVNRAKLYYLREKIGKKARVRELRQTPAQLAAARAESEANQAALDAAAAEAEAEAAAEAAAEAEPEVEESPRPRPRPSRRQRPSPRSLEPDADAEPRSTSGGRARRGRDLRDRRAGCREGVAPPAWPRWRWSPPAAASRIRSRKPRGKRCRRTCAPSAPTRATTQRTSTAPGQPRPGFARSRRISSRARFVGRRAAATGSVSPSTANGARSWSGWRNATPAARSASDHP